MDIAWRLCLELFLHDMSSSASVLVDEECGMMLVFDPTAFLSGKRLRMWRRVSEAGSTSPEKRRTAEAALEARDVVRLRQCVRTLVHYVCTTVRLVSLDDADAPHAAVYTMQSRIYGGIGAGPSTTYANAPRSSFAKGLLVQVSVHTTIVPWLSHVLLLHPSLRVDPTLAQYQGTATPQHGNLRTPRRTDESSVATEATPMISVADRDEQLQCEICLRRVSVGLSVFPEACAHHFCLTCITACAAKHCSAAEATPSSMPCPAFGCRALLLPHEVRVLVSTTQYSELEATEVRLALQEDCVVCPACSFTFESYTGSDVSETDPFRLKIRCPACSAELCKRCLAVPFHQDKLCPDGGTAANAPKCRYCGNAAVVFEPVVVCDAKDCQSKAKDACPLTKPCGHACLGSCGEDALGRCVPCLEDGCPHRPTTVHVADDFCAVCYTDALRDAPCLQLDCGHVLHKACAEKKIENRWPTARIGFQFFQCPICSADMAHPLLVKLTDPVRKLREQLHSRYVERLKIEGLWGDHAPHCSDPSSVYYGKPIDFARDKLNYYLCSKCQRPYFGGLRDCQDVNRDEPDRADLICGGCSAGSAVCERHGNQYMEWKCKYCCNTAVWYCWGTTHFCELCHSPPRKSVREECPGEELCPLKGKHQPNGTEFAIGCAMCRAEKWTNSDEKKSAGTAAPVAAAQ